MYVTPVSLIYMIWKGIVDTIIFGLLGGGQKTLVSLPNTEQMLVAAGQVLVYFSPCSFPTIAGMPLPCTQWHTNDVGRISNQYKKYHVNTHDVVKNTHDHLFAGGSVNTVVETEGKPRQPGWEAPADFWCACCCLWFWHNDSETGIVLRHKPSVNGYANAQKCVCVISLAF